MELSSCPNATKLPPQALPTATAYVHPSSNGATHRTTTTTFFVSTGGSDSGDGSEATPFQTLHKAQHAVRQLSPADRWGAVVNVLAGTYYLGTEGQGSLVFTPSDSGAAGAPVTWQAHPPGAAVVVSGGVKLDCAWSTVTMNGISAFKCTGIPASSGPIDSLFINGLRQKRARYPNGDPLVPNGPGGNGRAGYSKGAKPAGMWPNTAVALDQNVIVNSENGTLIAKGSAPGVGGTVVVKDIQAPRGVTTTGTTYANSSRFNDTYNMPVWATTSINAIHVPDDWMHRNWSKPVGAVVKMMHPAAWGSWGFEVGDYESSTGIMTFSKGGNQEARGNSGTGALYIENLMEELDAENEFFYDASADTLYFKPDNTIGDMGSALVEAPVLPRIIQFRGAADGTHVEHIAFVGFNISRATPTYLYDYEDPSGGDWSIHRGGAVFLDGAEGITFEQCKFDQLDGNAYFLSNYAKNNKVVDCDFWRTGDSAMAAVGSSLQMNGSLPTFPSGNIITGNHIDTVGIMMKQTSCYFKAITYNNTISKNICHNGPRAGVNFNDGFMGGDTLSENVIWAMVTETGDHGTFNSWDRKEWFYPCAHDPSSYCFMPATHQVHGNMFIGPAGWNMDHDDGSSEYHDFDNVVKAGINIETGLTVQ
jgi:hypothetical protein